MVSNFFANQGSQQSSYIIIGLNTCARYPVDTQRLRKFERRATDALCGPYYGSQLRTVGFRSLTALNSNLTPAEHR